MAETTNTQNEETARKGRGWRGDREGHARAGRLGGLARSRRRSGEDSSENNKEE